MFVHELLQIAITVWQYKSSYDIAIGNTSYMIVSVEETSFHIMVEVVVTCELNF